MPTAPEPAADDSGAPDADRLPDASAAAEPATEAGADGAEAAEVAEVAPVSRRNGRYVLLLAVIAAAVLVLDLITKLIVVATITPGESVRILGGLVYLSLYRNSGAAFSMATGVTWILTIVVVLVVVGIIRIATRLRSRVWAVCLGLILGGALGNLVDRLFRAPGFARGHVVDFVSVFGPDGKYFAIFNVADAAITCGGIALVITALLGIDFDGRRTGRRTKAAAVEDPPRPGPASGSEPSGGNGTADGNGPADG